MKALIILLVITITHDQLEAQIQSSTTSTKQSKPLIEVVFLKPTKHEKDNFESAYMGRYVVDNSIDGDYIPFKSAFAKKNRFFLNRRDAIEQNEISANEIPQTPNFPIIYQKFQYSKKKLDKLDLRNKIDKYNMKNKFIEATRSVKLSKASSKSQKLYDKNRIIGANFKEKSIKLRPTTPRMTFREFVKNMKHKINLEYSALNLNNSSTEVEKLEKQTTTKLTLEEFIHAMNSKIKNESSNVPLSKLPTEVQKLIDKIDFLKFHIFGSNSSQPSKEPKLSLKEFIHEMKLNNNVTGNSPNTNLTKVPIEVQKLNDKIDFLKFHIFGSNSTDPLKEPKLSLKEFIHEMKFNNNVTGISQNINLSKNPSIEVQKLNDKIDFLKFHIFGSSSAEPLKEPKLSLKEFIHEMKLNNNVTDNSQNINLSKVPSIEVQKLNDKIDFLKFHIFRSNSSEYLKEPKLSLKEFIHEMNFNNRKVSNLNLSQIPIKVQKLNDKIDFLKSHIFGPTLSEPKLSLKEFMHEMKLELNSRRNSNRNNFEIRLKNVTQEAEANNFHPEPKLLIEDYMQQDIDGGHQEISPTSPNHPKNRISNELQLPRELWAFAFNYEKFTFNPRRQPAIFKLLIKVPEYLKIPKYEEKVNRSLPKLILPFEKYEKLIRFVETDNKLLPQAITLFFGELPPMPSIPRRVELHQLEKRSTKILLPLIYKATEFRIYNEKNEVIYKVDASYWEKVKGKLSINFSPNNTAQELLPLLPEFYRSLNFTTNPDDLLPLSIKWLKLFVEDGRWFGPNRNKTSPYREYDYEFEEYYAEGNLNYLLGYFKRMQQDVLKQYLNMGGHGLPKPEQSFAFYVEVPEGAEPDFINIIEWGVELLTPRNHRWHEYNDTYEPVFIGEDNFQEPPAPTREKRLVNRIPHINVIECEVALITPKGTKVSQFNGEVVLQKAPSRIKRSEHTIPLGDPGLPPQILLALASVSGNGRRNIGESHTMHLHPNNKDVTSTKPVDPSFSETHKLNVPPSLSSVNDVASPGTSLEKIYSFPKSEYISQDVLPVFSNIEKDKPLIQRIIEKVKQGRDFFIHRNSTFPRSRFLQKYTNIRKNPLPKGTKKITINYGVPVYLKVVNDGIKPHEVYGLPQPRSKRSTLFETVFGNNKKSLHQTFHARFHEDSRKNNDKSNSVIGSKSIRNTYVKSDSVIGSKSNIRNTYVKNKSRSDIPTIIDSKCIVYGFPELFVKPKEEMTVPVTESRKISKVKISYGVPVYLRPYVAGSKSSKATSTYLDSFSFDLPSTTKSRPFAGSIPNGNFVTNFVPVTTKPKPFAVSNAEETTLKMPVSHSSNAVQKSEKKSETIAGETVRYSYYLGPNPANITVSREYFSETQPEKPQKVYGVPRTKRSIFNSFFKHNDNFETLQQRFFKVMKYFPVRKEAYEFPMESSLPLKQIRRKFIRELPNDQNNMRFIILTPKLDLPKSDEAKFITLNPILGTEPIQSKPINVHLNLSLPKTFSIKSFNNSYTNDGQINRMFLPATFTRPFKNVDDNIEVSPANEGSNIPSQDFSNNNSIHLNLSLPENFLIKSFNTDGYTHDVQSNSMLLPSTNLIPSKTSYDNIQVSSANGEIPSGNSSTNNNVHSNSSLPMTFSIKSSNKSSTNDVRFNRMILPSTIIGNLNTSDANNTKVSASHEELKTPSTNSRNKFLYKLYLPKLQLPETFNLNNTENDANLYRISLPSTITRNLKDPVKIEIPEKQTFEPRPVSIYFFKSNITAYQLLHYYLAPKLERSRPFSNSTSRSKRSIFASVFNTDNSKSLQQRFHEGTRGHVQYIHHKCKHTFSHRSQVQTARLQEYGVPFGRYGVPKYANNTQKSNQLSLPRIRLTKIFYNKLARNFNQLPIATRTRTFGKPLTGPERNKSPNSAVETARLQVPNFKSVSFGKYAVNSHMPLRNGMNLPKLRVNEYLNSKPYVTLTLPLMKIYRKVAFQESFNQLPIATKTRPFGEPLARPTINRSEIFSPNSLDNIENYTSSTSKLQTLNANKKNIFLVNKNITKYSSVPGSEFSNKSNGLNLPSSNQNTAKPDFAIIEPVGSYPKLPQALVDNINYNAQFSVGIASTKDDGLSNGSKNHTFEGKLLNLPKEEAQEKFNTSFNNSTNKSLVAPAVPLNQSLDYSLETLKKLPHLPKVESMNSLSSTLEPIRNISGNVNLPKILKNNSDAVVLPNIVKNNSLIEILPDLPKAVAGKHFTQNLHSLNLPEISKNNSFEAKLSNEPIKAIEENIKFNSGRKDLKSETKNTVGTIKGLELLPTIKIGNIFDKKIQTDIEKTNVTFNQAHAQKVPKPGPKTQNFNKDNNTIVSTHLRGKIKYSSQIRTNKTNNNTNITKFKINGQISTVSAPIENDLKIPTTDLKDKHFNPGSEESEYNSLLIPTKTRNNQNPLSKKSLKLPKENSITGHFITKDTINLPINLTVHEPIGNDLKIPITDSTTQHFNTENITNLPTDLPAAIEENIKFNAQFIPTKTDIGKSSTTENALKIPKTHSKFSNFNLKNTTNSFTSRPTVFTRIGNVPKIRKTQQFNSKTSTNLPPNLPKAIEENIKYNSQFVPKKTDIQKTPSTENALEIPKESSKIQHFKPETIVDAKITPQNVTNSKIPLTMQFQIPKTARGFMFKENAMLWPKVNIIRKNKTFVPVLDHTLKENIAYNVQFEKHLNVSHKNPKDTGIKEIVTNPPQIEIENSQTNNNTNKTNEPSLIEDNELPKDSSIKRLEESFFTNTTQIVQNVEVTSQAVKHRKRPVSIVAQWLKNKTLESSKPTNKDINRADIPIEEEISENTQIKNPLYVANRAKYPLTNKSIIKTNNTRVNIRKNLSNLYNVNNTKSRFIFKNRTQKNITGDALDNDNLPEKNIAVNLSESKKKKVLVKVVKRPSRKNIVANLLNQERAAENPELN